MSTQITLDIPDELLNRAKSLAQTTEQDWEKVIFLALSFQLLEFEYSSLSSQTFTQLTDERVKEMASLQLDQNTSQRVHDLLDRQQAGSITKAEALELSALNHVYDLALLVKSQGLAESVRRGLRPLSRG